MFSENLKRLVAEAPSVAAACRDIGINRTQFSRYLSGEAHPRPAVLARICDTFEVDARILLEPLDQIATTAGALATPMGRTDPFLPVMKDFDHRRMPDGLYQYVMPNMVDPGRLFAHFCRLSTGPSGSKRMYWSVPKFFARITGQSPLWKDRKFPGQVFQHTEGVSFLIANPAARILMHWFLSPGFRGAAHVHLGYATMSQKKGSMQSQVQPMILRKLPEDCGEVLATRRVQRHLKIEDLPSGFADYLQNWQPR